MLIHEFLRFGRKRNSKRAFDDLIRCLGKDGPHSLSAFEFYRTYTQYRWSPDKIVQFQKRVQIFQRDYEEEVLRRLREVEPWVASAGDLDASCAVLEAYSRIFAGDKRATDFMLTLFRESAHDGQRFAVCFYWNHAGGMLSLQSALEFQNIFLDSIDGFHPYVLHGAKYLVSVVDRLGCDESKKAGIVLPIDEVLKKFGPDLRNEEQRFFEQITEDIDWVLER